jgi:hypothetical protein
MPTPFDMLSQAQKDAFYGRVQQLGFDLTALAGGHLVTSGNGVRINGADREFVDHVKYKTLTSVDEIKRLLGVPDSTFKSSASDQHIRYVQPPKYADNKQMTLLALTQAERGDLETAAYAYLFGDSSKVTGWKNVINRLLLPRELSFVAYESITVKPGKPLILTNPSYTFGTVIIEQGGQIIVQSESKMDAQLLIKQS